MELHLAVDIAERVAKATAQKTAIDPQSEAEQLVAQHPEAEVTPMEVAAAMEEELGSRMATEAD